MRRRLMHKLLFMVGAIVILQLPLLLIDAKREERAARNDAAVRDVTAAWGGEQRVWGPLLVVPAERASEPGREIVLRLAPHELRIDGALEPRSLQRGIYRAQVYRATVGFQGRFVRPRSWVDSDLAIRWDQARVVCALDRPNRLVLDPASRWQDRALVGESGTGLSTWPAGVRAPVPLDANAEAWTFDLTLAFNGSGALYFAPLGDTTAVQLTSTATAPSFVGASLPDTRVVTTEGFEASWQTSPLDQAITRHWVGGEELDGRVREQLSQAAFGVNLLPGVTDYRSVERSTKYGILFLVTVFAGFFLSEIMGGRPLHLLNYLLVGAALCMFFLGLLASVELVGFGWAYAVAAVASTVLIVSYARAVMGGTKQAGGMAALLGGIFGYLFLVLRLEDLSLVAGTVLLFALLGAVMFATRKLRFDDGTALSPSA